MRGVLTSVALALTLLLGAVPAFAQDDTTPPTLTGGEIDGGTVTLTFSEPLDETSAGGSFWLTLHVLCTDHNGMNPQACGASFPATGEVEISGNTVVVGLGEDRLAVSGRSARFRYVRPTAPNATKLRDLAGNEMRDTSTIRLVNRTAPSPWTATVNRTTLTLTFDNALDGNAEPAANTFTVEVANQARDVTDVDVSGTTVTLTLASTVTTGQAVRVRYERPATGLQLQDGAGNAVKPFDFMSVNNVSDTTPPRAQSAQVSVTRLTITFSEALAAAPSLANSAFTVKKTPQGGSEETVALSGSPAISGTTLTLTLATVVLITDTAIQVSYTPPTSGANNTLQDAAGNAVVSFTQTVKLDYTPPGAAEGRADGATLQLIYNRDLDPTSKPAPDDFEVTSWDGSYGWAVINVALSGRTVTLTLNSAVSDSEGFILSYSPGANPLRDLAGNKAVTLIWPRYPASPTPPTGGGGGGGGGSGGGSSRPRDDHGNTAGRATRIQPGGRTAGQLGTRGDVDYFTLTAPSSGVLVVETTGSTATRGTVWQDGVEVASADSGGSGQNFRLSVRVEAGPVVIAVRGNGRQTGRYTLQTTLVIGYLENPTARSFQSGLGVISGWVCAGEAVTVEIEKADGTIVELAAAYGTERADTAAICGDTDTGFGVLVNWNLLGDGDHAVIVLVDGIELGRAPVTVTMLGAEFVEGLQGSVLVADFPRQGEQVRVVWQESQQNFVLAPVEVGAALTPAPTSGGIEGVLENPRPVSFQSGIGVISGWVCEAEAVVIEIDGQVIAAAAGTERADTLDRCGDVDNGFGLLVNWAEFGAGAHEVVALVDGAELSRATVTVTLVDTTEPFVRGLTKRVELPGFPTPEETVTLEWQEAQQNFVITGVE